MKKLFTCLMAVSSVFATTAIAQDDIQLMSFEDVSSDLFFKDGWYDGELFVTDPGVATNDVTDGINKTANSFVAINKAGAAWWGNFCVFGTSTPITISEEYKYMKAMVFRSEQSDAFRISINGVDTPLFNGNLKAAGVWEDVVMDLSAFIGTEIKIISTINLCAWTDPGLGLGGVAKYMYDEFVLSKDPLPRGVELKSSADFKFGFEDQDRLNKYVTSYSPQAEDQEVPNSIEIVDNPFTESAINAGGKVMKFNKCEKGTWWKAGPHFILNGLYPVGIDNPSHLHAMVKVPAIDEAIGLMVVQVSIKDHMGKEMNYDITLFDASDWVDLVVPVADELEYITEMTIRFDIQKNANDEWIGTPAGTYYVDAIELNNSDEARMTIVPEKGNAIAQTATDHEVIAIAADKAVQISATQDVTVQLITVNGQLLSKVAVKAGAVSTINVDQAGIYFVVASGANGTQTVKVAVK